MSVFNVEIAGATNFIGNVDIAGDLTAEDLTIDDLILTGVICAPAIETDLISTKTTGQINIDDDLVFNNNVKISNIVLDQAVPAEVPLHLRGIGTMGTWIESDVNGIGLQNPYLVLTNCMNRVGTELSLTDDDGVAFTEFNLIAGVTANATGGRVDIYTAQMTDNIDAKPTFATLSRMFRFANGGNLCERNLSMESNDITNAGSITSDTLILNSVATDNTNTNLLSIDGSGNVEIRTVASIPPTNPFDQTLNTTDDVQFDDVKCGTISGITSGTAMTVTADSTSVALAPGTILGILNTIQFTETGAPSNPPALSGKVYMRIGSPKFKDSAGTESDLINNFNQSLNGSDTPSFAGLGLTDDLDLNTNDIIDVTNLTLSSVIQITETAAPANPAASSGKVYMRLGSPKFKDSAGTESDLINNFDQSLNTSDTPSFAGLGLTDDLDLNANDIIDVANLTVSTNIELTTPVEDTSLNKFAMFDGSGNFKYKDVIFGNEYQSVNSTGTSTTTSATYQNKLTLTSGVVPAGDYIITWYADVSNSDKSKQTEVRIFLDSTTAISEFITPNLITDNNPIPYGGSIVTTLTNASHTYELDFRSIDATTASIEHSYLSFWRVN